MARVQKASLRALTADERAALEAVARAGSERADRVARAKALLAVAAGSCFAAAARAVGRRSGDAVAQLVARFNTEGLAALAPGHGGGPHRRYGAAEQERILCEFRRTPERRRDGTATWSLTTLERTLRQEGLPHIGGTTIRRVLRAAGSSYQRTRSWCPTGTAVRKRKDGPVRVSDPQTEQKRGASSRRTG